MVYDNFQILICHHYKPINSIFSMTCSSPQHKILFTKCEFTKIFAKFLENWKSALFQKKTKKKTDF